MKGKVECEMLICKKLKIFTYGVISNVMKYFRKKVVNIRDILTVVS